MLQRERRQHDLAKRGAMRRTHHADAVCELESAGAAGARQHHHCVTHAHGKMSALAGFARKILEDGRRQTDHFNFVESTSSKREERAANAIPL